MIIYFSIDVCFKFGKNQQEIFMLVFQTGALISTIYNILNKIIQNFT